MRKSSDEARVRKTPTLYFSSDEWESIQTVLESTRYTLPRLIELTVLQHANEVNDQNAKKNAGNQEEEIWLDD